MELKVIKSDFLPEISDMESGVLYLSEKYNISQHICPCGCKQPSVLIHKPGEWNYQFNTENQITIRPSILNRFCKAHYYITNSKIEML